MLFLSASQHSHAYFVILFHFKPHVFFSASFLENEENVQIHNHYQTAWQIYTPSIVRSSYFLGIMDHTANNLNVFRLSLNKEKILLFNKLEFKERTPKKIVCEFYKTTNQKWVQKSTER